MVVALLKELDKHPSQSVGDATVAYLLAQTADARTWPTDNDLRAELPDVKVYGNIKQQRLRAILSGVELQLRTQRHEDVSLPAKLDIEHVMPQGWRSYWQDGMLHDPEACADRDLRINTIGNLTLVTKSLNSTLSNRPWTDDDAAGAPGSGADKGLGKRSLLNKYSVLALSSAGRSSMTTSKLGPTTTSSSAPRPWRTPSPRPGQWVDLNRPGIPGAAK